MEKEIFKLASSQGIWTALSVALIFYILKVEENRDLKKDKRQENYRTIIENFKLL